jgi:hypothetical protein
MDSEDARHACHELSQSVRDSWGPHHSTLHMPVGELIGRVELKREHMGEWIGRRHVKLSTWVERMCPFGTTSPAEWLVIASERRCASHAHVTSRPPTAVLSHATHTLLSLNIGVHSARSNPMLIRGRCRIRVEGRGGLERRPQMPPKTLPPP